jgi:DNA-binding protein HU-beta
MNKRDLIDAISGQLGSKKTATDAVNAVLDTIQLTVAKGDKVAITGFGVFEKAIRPARTARNPATGATIKVPKSSVPKFRAGADFKAVVNGEKKPPAAKKR